ncbi:MGDG synthase family glycosyltransferase [Carboxydothermus pertinax]|uniref:Galactosyldiacylglycerol synthase n=1 Tax=Carboxydothermus pertinax TaxID=870242 RepID=A0A1L8CUM1_9THEO|nr:glycosyltransferase [Carboxydothermus pertinax]GAV22597.1 hypothetical protein cpu_11070 [Carboxydothermus pertinax]
MKILLLAERFGHGHLKAAQNLQKAFKAIDPPIEVEVLTALSLIGPKIEELASGIYLKILAHIPKIWGYIYEKGHDKEKDRLRWLVALLYKKRLSEIIEEFKPDGIINTHAFPAIALDFLGLNNYATVITDYDYHAFWLTERARFYYVAAEEIADKLVARGYSRNRVYAFGPPIDPLFGEEISRQEVRRKLQINENSKVILLMGGGLGLGPMADAVKILMGTKKEWVIIVLCGHNQRLYKELLALKHPNLVPVPFTPKVPEFLAAADLVVTKPGGLSTAEALALGKPLIIINPLPGQEKRNAEFLQKKGAAIFIKDLAELIPAVTSSLLTPAYQRLTQNAAKLGKKDASLNIARHYLRNIGQNISGGD